MVVRKINRVLGLPTKKPLDKMEGKMKKMIVIAFVIMVLIIGAVKMYGSWVNCSGPFPGTCTQGGCLNPESAEGCYLRGCKRGDHSCQFLPI